MENVRQEWVRSRTGKPVHLVDWSLRLDATKDYQRIAITKDMAEKQIPLLVFYTGFVQGYASDPINILELLSDKAEAKRVHDEYFKIVDTEQKQLEAEKKDTDKNMERAVKAAKDAFDSEMNKFKSNNEAKPKVVRKRAAGNDVVIS